MSRHCRCSLIRSYPIVPVYTVKDLETHGEVDLSIGYGHDDGPHSEDLALSVQLHVEMQPIVSDAWDIF